MKWLHLFNANFRRDWINLKRYLPNTITMIITMYSIFLLMFFGITVVGDPSTAEQNIQFVIVNYLFWYLAMEVMQGMGWSMAEEARLGTLEQLYMSPLGVTNILLGRIVSTTIYSLGLTGFLLYLSMWTAGTWLPLPILEILPILLFAVLGMIGVSFMIAGLTILIKQVQAFLQILQFVFMALTFVPLSVAPYLAAAPFVKGVDMIREMMVLGVPFSSFTAEDFSILIVTGFFYFAIGIGVFRYCERMAMKKGVLGQY